MACQCKKGSSHRYWSQPRQDHSKKYQAVLDSGGGGAVLFGIFAFIALAIALEMRQSNEQRQADIQRMEVRQQQNKAQEAKEAKKGFRLQKTGKNPTSA